MEDKPSSVFFLLLSIFKGTFFFPLKDFLQRFIFPIFQGTDPKILESRSTLCWPPWLSNAENFSF